MLDLTDTAVFSALCHPTGNDFFTPCGSQMADKYEMKLDKNGHKVLEKVGEINIYDKIQESLEGCKIENIINRIMAGDTSMLRNSPGVYMDCTELPKSLMELQNLNIKLENQFMALPVDERAKYNHNVGEYLKAIDDEMQKKMKEVANANTNESAVPPVSEGTTSESKS